MAYKIEIRTMTFDPSKPSLTQEFCNQKLFDLWYKNTIVFPQTLVEGSFVMLKYILENKNLALGFPNSNLTNSQELQLRKEMEKAHKARGGHRDVPDYRMNSLYKDFVIETEDEFFKLSILLHVFASGNDLNSVRIEHSNTLRTKKMKILQEIENVNPNILKLMHSLVQVYVRRMYDLPVLDLTRKRNELMFQEDAPKPNYLGDIRDHVYKKAFSEFNDVLKTFFGSEEKYLLFLKVLLPKI